MIQLKGSIQIGEVSKQSGTSIDAIRYYEKFGLLKSPVRSEGGFRLYPDEIVDRLHFIKKAQGFGFTLGEIKQIMRQSDRGLENCCGFVEGLLENKMDELEIKIKELRDMRKGLRGLMQCWIPLKKAKKTKYAVCPQIETDRPQRRGGKRHG